MATSWSTFRRAAGVACLWLGLLSRAHAEQTESIRGRGVVAGEALFLFGEVHRCGAEQTLPEAQIFVSTDGGKTWQKAGPALPGTEILFARLNGQTLWAAGEHTAEGPAVDPFALVPAPAARPDWVARPIVDGPAELVGVAVAGGQDLSAKVRRTGPHGEKTSGTQELVSHDGGRSWSPGKAAAKDGPGPFQPLSPVRMRSGAWRLVDRKDGGFDLQKRSASGWSTVNPFPWTRCPE